MCFSLFEKIFIQGAAERFRGKEKKPAEKATFFRGRLHNFPAWQSKARRARAGSAGGTHQLLGLFLRMTAGLPPSTMEVEETTVRRAFS